VGSFNKNDFKKLKEKKGHKGGGSGY